MTDVILCSAAERDYTDSLTSYAERSVQAAEQFEREFEQALTQISQDPERFPKADERHHFYLMRQFPFQILFRVREDGVYVITVAHTSRSPDFWKGR